MVLSSTSQLSSPKSIPTTIRTRRSLPYTAVACPSVCGGMAFVSWCWYKGVRGTAGVHERHSDEIHGPRGAGQASLLGGRSLRPFWRLPRLWSSCCSSSRAKPMPKPRTETLPGWGRVPLRAEETLPGREALLRAAATAAAVAAGNPRKERFPGGAAAQTDREAPLRATAAAPARVSPTRAAAP